MVEQKDRATLDVVAYDLPSGITWGFWYETQTRFCAGFRTASNAYDGRRDYLLHLDYRTDLELDEGIHWIDASDFKEHEWRLLTYAPTDGSKLERKVIETLLFNAYRFVDAFNEIWDSDAFVLRFKINSGLSAKFDELLKLRAIFDEKLRPPIPHHEISDENLTIKQIDTYHRKFIALRFDLEEIRDLYARAYGYTITSNGELAGLTSGDQGYEGITSTVAGLINYAYTYNKLPPSMNDPIGIALWQVVRACMQHIDPQLYEKRENEFNRKTDVGTIMEDGSVCVGYWEWSFPKKPVEGKERKIPMTVRMSSSLRDELHALAEQEGVSINTLLIRAIRQELEDNNS